MRLQVLNLRGFGEAASRNGTLSQVNVEEWEKKAGKLRQPLWFQ